MSRISIIVVTLSLLSLLALGTSLPAGAQGISPSWWSVDNGGTYAAAGDYTLGATVGQPDTGTASGGWYTVRAGYWPGAIVRHIVVYVPVGDGFMEIVRQFTYGQLTIVLGALVLIAVWARRGRRPMR